MVYIVSGDVYSCGSIAFLFSMSGMSLHSRRYRIRKELGKGPAFCLVKRAHMIFGMSAGKQSPFLKLLELSLLFSL